jgi:hypothetical protein
LGQPTHLAMKVKGETSMSVTAGMPEDIYGVVRLVPDDMVKARLPEPQFPAISRRSVDHNAYKATSPR